MLKVCYVPATSASLPRVSFFFSFLFLLLWPLTVLMKQTRCSQAVYILNVYGEDTIFRNLINKLTFHLTKYQRFQILFHNFRHRFQVKFKKDFIGWNIPRNPYWRGRLSTVGLLELTSLQQLILIHKKYYLLFVSEQARLMRRSTVLSFPRQWVWTYPLQQADLHACISLIINTTLNES